MLGGNPFRTASLALFILVIYVLLGYFVPREDSLYFLMLYGSCWGLTYVLLKNSCTKSIFWLGLLFRLIFIVALPWLSQDFYRFIWDGLLLQNDLNPYTFSPNELINNDALFDSTLKTTLYEGMGALSAQHYSNYPPVNQLGFLTSVNLFPQSVLGTVIVMRLLLILAEVGLFFAIRKILYHLDLPHRRLGWYFLNPLIILELTGNLHWEGVMLFFFALGWWFLLKKQNIWATIAFAFSIATKLIPLLLLPLFVRFQAWKKTAWMAFLGSICLLLLFVPFFKDIGMENYFATIQLWFKNFEFNGSFYYLIRWIGYQIKGYNIIRQWGEISPWIIIGMVLIFAFLTPKKKAQEVFSAMLLLLTAYYLIASIVHPWYVIPLVFLSLFTRYSFPLIWSMLIPISYITYAHPNFQEEYRLIFLEYVIVIIAMIYEISKRKTLLKHF